MVEARAALFRIDFCADVAAAQAPIINLGYMLEAAVEGGARFLGLASRTALTRVELDLINIATWPELESLDDYMGKMFERGWDMVNQVGDDHLRLGSDELARQFTAASALHIGRIDMPVHLMPPLQDPDEEVWQTTYYRELRSYGRLLKPTLTGAVLPFRQPTIAPTPLQRPKYRSEAA